MIAGGAALVTEYGCLLYVFAVFLVFTGIKMLFAGDKPMDVAGNPVVRWLSRHIPITNELHGEKFFVRVPDTKTGKIVLAATTMFRSEERRGGNEWVCTCRSRCVPEQ